MLTKIFILHLHLSRRISICIFVAIFEILACSLMLHILSEQELQLHNVFDFHIYVDLFCSLHFCLCRSFEYANTKFFIVLDMYVLLFVFFF